MRPAGGLVPVPGLLDHGVAAFEEGDLPGRLVLDGPGQRAQRVEVLDLTAGPERRPPPGRDRDVGVDPHRALLHAAVGGARGHQDPPQLGRVGAGLRGRAHVGLADDLDQRHAGAVVVDQGVVGRVDAAAAPTWVVLPVSSSRWARVTPITVPSGSSSEPPTLIGSSYWLIW